MKHDSINRVITVAVFALVFTWTHAVSALNIGYVVGSDGVVDKPFDIGWSNRLTLAGHTVTPFAQTTASTDPTLASMDLFIVSSDVGSGTFLGGIGVDQPQPYITYEYGIYDEIFGGSGSALTDVANNIVILDDTSPLAAGLIGTVSVYTGTGDSPRGTGTQVAGTQVIAESAIPSGNAVLMELEAGQLGGTGVAWPSRRIAVPVYDTWDPALVTADGWKIFDAAVLWAVNTNPPVAPTVTITNPVFAQAFSSNANVLLAATTTEGNGGAVVSVSYFANGVSIGISTTGPSFSLTWSNVPTGRYALSAKVTDAAGYSRYTPKEAPVLIKVGAPVDQITMVVGNVTLNADDQAIADRISALGFAVAVLDDNYANTNLAYDSVGIFISASVAAETVGTNFTLANVGVYNAEVALQDDLLFTGPTEFLDYGQALGQSNVVIVNPASPLAGGLSGTVQVTASPIDFAWGYPAAAASKVANLDVTPPDAVLYSVETNTALVDGMTTAPARRVQTFFQSGFAQLNPNGLKLFDAGMAWILGKTNLGSPPAAVITSPVAGQRFPVGNIPLAVVATDPNGNNTIAKVEYFMAGTNLIAMSTTSPFSATWSNATTGYHDLTAVVTDTTGLSGVSPKVKHVTVGDLPPRFLFVCNTGAGAADRRNDLALQQRIAAFGYDVIDANASATTLADTEGVAGVYIAASVSAAAVGSKFNNAMVPLLNCEPAVQDDMLFAISGSSSDSGTTSGTEVVIVGAGHPLAGGLPNGTVSFNNGGATATGWAVINNNPGSAIGVATLTNDTTKFVIYAFDTGSYLGDGMTTAPARRVNLGFMQNNNYDNLTAEGFALLDAALEWALNTSLPGLAAPVLNRPVLLTNGIVVSWTGVGVLDRATNVSGSYVPVPWPLSPYTNTITQPEAYFRLRQ